MSSPAVERARRNRTPPPPAGWSQMCWMPSPWPPKSRPTFRPARRRRRVRNRAARLRAKRNNGVRTHPTVPNTNTQSHPCPARCNGAERCHARTSDHRRRVGRARAVRHSHGRPGAGPSSASPVDAGRGCRASSSHRMASRRAARHGAVGPERRRSLQRDEVSGSSELQALIEASISGSQLVPSGRVSHDVVERQLYNAISASAQGRLTSR